MTVWNEIKAKDELLLVYIYGQIEIKHKKDIILKNVIKEHKNLVKK